MKPHEEEWELRADDPESGPEIRLRGGGVLFDCNDADRARLATAAPNMARLLLASGGYFADGHGQRQWHTFDCEEHGHTSVCDATRAALRKAGVLP